MLARITVPRRVPRLLLAVRYKSNLSDSPAGSVAQSKGFSKKEKAHEDEYIHRHEIAQLAKMRTEIEKKKQELNDLQKEHDSLVKGGGKQQ